MLIIGLTGGIACGKTTVSKKISALGIPVVDADTIARQVVEPGTPAYKQVVDAFSAEVPDLVNPDGSLNRAELGKAVFGNKERLGRLNRIVHAAVKREMARQVFSLYLKGNAAAVLDIPLLFETGLDRVCGATITVACSDETQLQRLLHRNPELSKEDAEKRILSQLSSAERARRADRVIANDGTLEELENEVSRAMAELVPGTLWRVLALFPPWGLISAVFTVAWRTGRDWWRQPPKEKTD